MYQNAVATLAVNAVATLAVDITYGTPQLANMSGRHSM
jgi:hypothetical protein